MSFNINDVKIDTPSKKITISVFIIIILFVITTGCLGADEGEDFEQPDDFTMDIDWFQIQDIEDEKQQLDLRVVMKNERQEAIWIHYGYFEIETEDGTTHHNVTGDEGYLEAGEEVELSLSFVLPEDLQPDILWFISPESGMEPIQSHI